MGGDERRGDSGGDRFLEEEGHREGDLPRHHSDGTRHQGRTAGIRLQRRQGHGLDRKAAEAAGWTGGVQGACAPESLLGHAPAVPGPRLFVAFVPASMGSGGMLGRRHGPGQDDSDHGANPAGLADQWQAAGTPRLPNLRDKQLAEGGRPLHSWTSRAGASRRGQETRCGFREGGRKARHRRLQLRTVAAGRQVPQGGAVERRRARRGPKHQEPRDQAGAGRTVAGSRLPHRPDRNAGREQRGRPVVDHGVFEPWFPRVPERVQAQLLRAHSGRAGPERGGAPQARYRPVHPPEAQDGQVHHLRPAGEAGDEGLLFTDEGAGLSVRRRPQGDGRDAGVGRGYPAERAGPGHALQAQAGLQPPGAVSGRQPPPASPTGPASWPG